MTSRIRNNPRSRGSAEFDLIVVGGGPAGIAAAISSARRGWKTLVLEKLVIGGLAGEAPLIDNYPGYFEGISNMDFIDLLRDQAKKVGVIVRELVEVRDILYQKDPIVVTHSRIDVVDWKAMQTIFRFTPEAKQSLQQSMKNSGFKSESTTKAVILATGTKRRRLRVPGASEFDGLGVSYNATCDGSLYQWRKVVVVGGGDAAVTEALYLDKIVSEVTLIHRRGCLRASQILQEELLEHSTVKIVLNTLVTEILGSRDAGVRKIRLRNVLTGEEQILRTRCVFVAIGTIPNNELAKKIGLELSESGFIRVDNHHRTNFPRIYAAGDITSGRGQIAIAVGEGTTASTSAFLDVTRNNQSSC